MSTWLENPLIFATWLTLYNVAGEKTGSCTTHTTGNKNAEIQKPGQTHHSYLSGTKSRGQELFNWTGRGWPFLWLGAERATTVCINVTLLGFPAPCWVLHAGVWERCRLQLGAPRNRNGGPPLGGCGIFLYPAISLVNHNRPIKQRLIWKLNRVIC